MIAFLIQTFFDSFSSFTSPNYDVTLRAQANALSRTRTGTLSTPSEIHSNIDSTFNESVH